MGRPRFAARRGQATEGTEAEEATQGQASTATATDMAGQGEGDRGVHLGDRMGTEFCERVAREVARRTDAKASAMPRKALAQVWRSGGCCGVRQFCQFSPTIFQEGGFCLIPRQQKAFDDF